MPQPTKLDQAYELMLFWTNMEAPPYLRSKPQEPFAYLQVETLPAVDNVMKVRLPQLATIGQDPPLIRVKGKVKQVSLWRAPGIENRYQVHLEQVQKRGLSYLELSAYVGCQMVGYHPDFGRVVGELIALSPKHQIAGLKDKSLREFIELDDDELDDAEREAPTAWVDWSSVWPHR